MFSEGLANTNFVVFDWTPSEIKLTTARRANYTTDVVRDRPFNLQVGGGVMFFCFVQCKVRNEIETKRNATERNETKSNETKRNRSKRNKTKSNETKRNETTLHFVSFRFASFGFVSFCLISFRFFWFRFVLHFTGTLF